LDKFKYVVWVVALVIAAVAPKEIGGVFASFQQVLYFGMFKFLMFGEITVKLWCVV
jgi:hypothetical protein